MFDIIDRGIAYLLDVTPEEYVAKIESLDEEAASNIIYRLMSGNEEEVKEGVKLFNDI